jgi:hypothetical protein
MSSHPLQKIARTAQKGLGAKLLGKETSEKLDLGGQVAGAYKGKGSEQYDEAKKAKRNVIKTANELYAAQRKRQRAAGSSLSTGAGDSGGATTTSAMAYGKSTLGG